MLNQNLPQNAISSMAFDLYIMHFTMPDIKKILYPLLMMDAGPEFENTEKELRTLSQLLIEDEENPMSVIEQMMHERFQQNLKN